MGGLQEGCKEPYSQQVDCIIKLKLALRACTTRRFELSVCCVFCKIIPGELETGIGRRLARGRRRLVLQGRVDAAPTAVPAAASYRRHRLI